MKRDSIRFEVAVIAVMTLAVVAALTWAVVVLVQEAAEPDSGIITGKEYHAESTWIWCHPVGKATLCTPQTTPECYEIDYADGDSTGDACVSSDEYRTYEIGGRYPH